MYFNETYYSTHYQVHIALMSFSRLCIQRSRSQTTFSKRLFASRGILVMVRHWRPAGYMSDFVLKHCNFCVNFRHLVWVFNWNQLFLIHWAVYVRLLWSFQWTTHTHHQVYVFCVRCGIPMFMRYATLLLYTVNFQVWWCTGEFTLLFMTVCVDSIYRYYCV